MGSIALVVLFCGILGLGIGCGGEPAPRVLTGTPSEAADVAAEREFNAAEEARKIHTPYANAGYASVDVEEEADLNVSTSTIDLRIVIRRNAR